MDKKRNNLFMWTLGIIFAILLLIPGKYVSGEGYLNSKTKKSQNSQINEDQIKTTLEDAAKALGGGFIWESGSTWGMSRIEYVGINDADYPVDLTEYIIILLGDPCENLGWQSITFHGMQGCAFYEGDHLRDLIWTPKNGYKFDGNPITFEAISYLGYNCSENNNAEGQKRASCDSENALPLAEALHQAAIKNGLYEPIPEESLPVETDQAIVKEQPEVVVVPYGGETEAPSEAEQEVVIVPYGETPPDGAVAEAGSFDETWQSPQAKAVRSPLLPIAGGIIGTGLAWLLAQGSAHAASTAVPIDSPVYAPTPSRGGGGAGPADGQGPQPPTRRGAQR